MNTMSIEKVFFTLEEDACIKDNFIATISCENGSLKSNKIVLHLAFNVK